MKYILFKLPFKNLSLPRFITCIRKQVKSEAFPFRLSVSNDLKVDAERDLRDIGATKIDVHPLNKVKNQSRRPKVKPVLGCQPR